MKETTLKTTLRSVQHWIRATNGTVKAAASRKHTSCIWRSWDCVSGSVWDATCCKLHSQLGCISYPRTRLPLLHLVVHFILKDFNCHCHQKIRERIKVTLMSWESEKANGRREFVARVPQISHINVSKHNADKRGRTGNAQSTTKWKETRCLQQNKATNALKPLSATTYIIQLLGNLLYAAILSSPSDSDEDTHAAFLGLKWTLILDLTCTKKGARKIDGLEGKGQQKARQSETGGRSVCHWQLAVFQVISQVLSFSVSLSNSAECNTPRAHTPPHTHRMPLLCRHAEPHIESFTKLSLTSFHTLKGHFDTVVYAWQHGLCGSGGE